MAKTDAGALRERLTIERAVIADDGGFGVSHSWSTLATVWGEVLPMAGREILLNQALQGLQAYRIKIRFYSGLTVKDRINWRGVLLNIRSLADVDGDRKFTTVYADSGVVAE